MFDQTSSRRLARHVTTGLLAGALALGATTTVVVTAQDRPAPTSAALTTAAAGGNRPTPRNFTGYGFDQCLAPTQNAMDAWLRSSPFWAVGIYISGKSRACRSQPNLTRAWVRTQLANRWRLIPITLGPQASCSTRFPRYGNDPTISADPSNNYGRARAMGRAEADDAASVASNLGIVPGSTLWYDLEAFDIRLERCRESALRFVSAWTTRLHTKGYVSGFYSSAASGIRMLDDARVNRPKAFALPDRIWIADWDQKANVESSYIRRDGWKPGGRMKQYRGGHNETHGGVTINIDSNFLDLGRGSTTARKRHLLRRPEHGPHPVADAQPGRHRCDGEAAAVPAAAAGLLPRRADRRHGCPHPIRGAGDARRPRHPGRRPSRDSGSGSASTPPAAPT